MIFGIDLGLAVYLPCGLGPFHQYRRRCAAESQPAVVIIDVEYVPTMAAVPLKPNHLLQLPIQAAVVDGFEDVVGGDGISIGQVGDGAADPQNLIVSAGGEA